MEDYYALLSIPKKATQDEIKNAYRAKVKQYHPDLYNTESSVEQMQAEKMTILINNAYEILSDTIKKSKYDNTIGNYQNKNSQKDRKDGFTTERNRSNHHNDQRQRTSNGIYTSKRSRNQYQSNTDQNKENKKNGIEDELIAHLNSILDDFPLYFSLSLHIEEMEKHLIIIKRSHISFDDELIRTIAKTKPTTKDKLRLINGITDDDINRHGDTIINIILEYLELNDEINKRK